MLGASITMLCSLGAGGEGRGDQGWAKEVTELAQGELEE